MPRSLARAVALLFVLALLTAPATVLAAPAVTIVPAAGPPGAEFRASGTGFGALEPLFSRIVPAQGNAGDASLVPFRADESGGFTGPISSERAPGTYRLEIVNGGGAVVATATFTVTSGDAPASTPTPVPGPSPAPSPGTPPTAGRQCFTETNKCIEGRFLTYWQEHGALAINGYPLSDVFTETLEDGKQYQVQYFERVRLEAHPENPAPNDVLLGQFGRRIRPADPAVEPRPGAAFFTQTGHNLEGRFLTYWQANGGLAQFGYPLSEVFRQQLEDGREYDVQYFERARFELHPENAAPYDVLLGQFGRRILGNR